MPVARSGFGKSGYEWEATKIYVLESLPADANMISSSGGTLCFAGIAPKKIVQCRSIFVTGALLTPSKILFEKLLYLEA
jgi:hypothetical protein